MMAVRQEMSVADAQRLLTTLSGAKTAEREIANLRFAPAAQFASGARWKPGDAREVAFVNLEWTHGSIVGGLLGRGRVKASRFDHVNLDDFRCRKIDFLDCHFERVTFGEHFLGLIKDCTFTRCSFVKCRLDAVGFVGSALRSCRFDTPTGTDRARWEDCSLEEVTFSGTLDGVHFIDCVLHNVDMSEAKLHEVSILHTKDGEARLPDRPDNFAIHPRLFLDAEATLGSKLDPAALEAYRGTAKMLARLGSPFILDAPLLDVLLRDLPAGDRPVVMATLYDLRKNRPVWAPATSSAR